MENWKILSQIWGKMAYVSTPLVLEKSVKKQIENIAV